MGNPKREPPTLEQAVARARCGLVLCLRDMAEAASRALGAPPDFMPRQIEFLIESFDLAGAFTATERNLLDAPYGTIADPDRLPLIAAADMLHTLLWALGTIDDFDSVRPSSEARRRDFQTANALSDEEVAQRGFRPSAAISRAHLTYELLLWRIRLARAEGRGEFDEAERRDRLKSPLERAGALGLEIGTLDGDIVLDRQAFATLTQGDCNQIYWVALARYATLGWLLGFFEDWDQAHFYSHELERRAGLEPPEMPEPGPHRPRPDERAVSQRVVALTTLFFRARIEADARRTGGSELPKSFRDRLQQPEIAGALSPREAELIARDPGTWTDQEYLGAAWRLEALGCLLWTLGHIEEMPPYDVPFTPDLFGRPRSTGNDRGFRPSAEIDHARHVAEMWHWRSRTAQLMQKGRMPPTGLTYAKILEVTANAAQKDGDLPPPINGDFPLFGKAYGALSEDEFNIAHSIALERHYAFNWLCGYGPDWDNVSTDT